MPQRFGWRPGRPLTLLGMARLALAGLVLLSLSSGCVQDISAPELGDCAEYPQGVYDYGSIGVGNCLAAPVDLKVYDDAGSEVLLVVNSNDFWNYSGGSLLAVDLRTLVPQLDTLTAQFDGLEKGDPLIPEVILIKNDDDSLDIPDFEDLGVQTSAIDLPNFSGRVVTGRVVADQELPVAFVSNRYSDTTERTIPDYVYAVDLSDPLALLPFDLSGESSSAPEDRFLVGDDPFGMAFVNGTNGRYLYVVNETQHSVSVVAASQYPIEPVSADAVGLISNPIFQDTDGEEGGQSLAEMQNLAVTGYVISDDWTMTYLGGTVRAWYGGDGSGEGVVGLADSGDGLSFTTLSSSPILEPGDASLCEEADAGGTQADRTECAWDSGDIERVSILPVDDDYWIFYSATGEDEFGVYGSRIGAAATVGSKVGTVGKYDVGDNGKAHDDFIVGLGVSGDFDEAGVHRPWVSSTGEDSSYVMWYIGENADGDSHLGTLESTDLVTWDGRKQVRFYDAYDSDSGSFESSDEITEDVGQIRDATGYWDAGLERFRLWFVRELDTGWCLAYAESETSAGEFKLGSLERGDVGDGCVEYVGDAGLEAPFLSSPSVSEGNGVVHLWLLTSESGDSDDWTLRYARSSDGSIWYPFEPQASLASGADWEGGNPRPTIVRLTPGDVLRLEGAEGGVVDSQLPAHLTNSTLYGTAAFAFRYGFVLGVGDSATLTSPYDENDSDSTERLSEVAWDSERVGEPAYDPATGELYYVGQSETNDTDTFLDDQASIGVATPVMADDIAPELALQWSNADSAELSPGLEGMGESYTYPLSGPEVITVGGKTYLFYVRAIGGGRTAIYLRTKSEGEKWSSPSQLLESQEGEALGAPSVLAPAEGDSTWHMWFTTDRSDRNETIGYAHSENGSSWSRGTSNILDDVSNGDWDDEGQRSPSVIRIWDDRGRLRGFRMWYAGFDGLNYRIGTATAEAATGAEVAGLEWTRYRSGEYSEATSVLEGAFQFWDADGTAEPEVYLDGERYLMWYEGWRGSNHRIGLAQSWDGIRWDKVFAAPTTGDTFSFKTSRVLQGSEEEGAYGTPSNYADGVISLEVEELQGQSFSGIGASEIAVAPDNSIAVLGVRHTSAVYVLDTDDNSEKETGWMDANYHGIEAIITWKSNNATKESRSIVFGPTESGSSRFYMTTAHPDSVMVFDRDRIPDHSTTSILDDVLLGAISLEPGVTEDQGEESSTGADIGPSGLAISNSGRYLWVANANANSVYTIDLERGDYGEVVAVAKNVGELPVALALSPDERYLFVSNYVGEMSVGEDDSRPSHGTIAVIDSDPTSGTFGRTVAKIKNLVLED